MDHFGGPPVLDFDNHRLSHPERVVKRVLAVHAKKNVDRKDLAY